MEMLRRYSSICAGMGVLRNITLASMLLTSHVRLEGYTAVLCWAYCWKSIILKFQITKSVEMEITSYSQVLFLLIFV